MPLGLDSIVQQNTGSFDGSSGTVSLSSSTTADNHVIIAAMSASDGSTQAVLGLPSGFSWASNELASSNEFTTPYIFYKKTSGGETSWTLAYATGSNQVCWAVFEVTGLDLTTPVHVAGSINPFDDSGTVTTRSTGTASATSSYDTFGLAIHPARSPSGTVPVWSGHTNGWTELAQVSHSDASHSVAMSVSAKPSLALVEHEVTASLSLACNSRATLVVFTAQDAKWAPQIDAMCGFELGTTTSITNTSTASGMTGSAVFDGVVGSPAINTSTPRSGGSAACLELSSSAAAECVTWTNPGVLSLYGKTTDWTGPCVERLSFHFPSSLPGADTELGSVEAGSLANGVTFWYRSASQKIGVKIGTGTEQPSDATVSADTWYSLDYRYDATPASHTCDWQLDYGSGPVAQTQAVGASTSSATITTVRKGWTTSKTATVRYDDIALSKIANNYPIGDLHIRLLKVDPNGTPSINGTSTDFRTFTNNGTTAVWNAAAAVAALDDVPPTIGGSADGITQITASSTNYARIPMDTYTAAPTDVLRAVRWYFAPWAASGTAATFGMRVFDGTNEYNVGAQTVDHGQDDTALMWVCRMLRAFTGTSSPYYIVTQARLDALEARFGFSDDATPDVGLHTVFIELATQPASVFEVLNIEDGAFTVDVRVDPVSGAVASYLVTVPPAPNTRGATATFTVDGADSSVYVDPDVANTYEKVIGASSIEQATNVGLTADPA